MPTPPRPEPPAAAGALAGRRIGLIGLGIMGGAMGRHLLRGGAALHVFARAAGRTEALRGAGAQVCGTPAALAAATEAIVLCVTDEAAVAALLEGPEGILAGAAAGHLVVDCSTIDPAASVALGGRAAGRGVALVDAPVSGGSEGAAAGSLAAMVGGDAAAVARATPILRAFCARVTHVGGPGAGQTVKLMNQILVVGHALAMSEALLFAQDAGVDCGRALEAVGGGAAASWMLQHRAPQVLADDFRPGFTVDNQQKDLRLVLRAGHAQGTPLLGTALAAQLYATLQARGLGGEGNHALIKALARLRGP